jgi:CDP-diacylglycerol--glycerol-3-phosphate 3-phosphatidyltransferase
MLASVTNETQNLLLERWNLFVEQAKEKKQRLTLTDQLRITFKGITEPIAGFFNRLGLMPNTMTLLGLAGNVAGAILLSQGYMFWGGILILVMGPVDALDGTMARLRGMAGSFGAFVDSVTDRYSELIIFGGLIYYYAQQNDMISTIAVYAAAAGSVLVSYIRSRGQSLGWDTKVGILTRAERYLVLAPSLILGIVNSNIPLIGIWIIAVLANVTAVQRIIDVRRRAQQELPNL